MAGVRVQIVEIDTQGFHEIVTRLFGVTDFSGEYREVDDNVES